MTARIDSIYYFDYTEEIGYYDSLRNFASVEMKYIGLALSTPTVRVNATPNSFNVSSDGSSCIREYVISQLANLSEISKDLAVNSPKYILINYFDGTERYFAYNESFCSVFKMAFLYKPQETEEAYESPYVIQKTETTTTHNYSQQPKPATQQGTYTTPMTYTQQSSATRYVPPKNEKPFPWGKLIFGIAIFVVIIGIIVSSISGNTDSGLTPMIEPRSGAILSGSEVYDGSEITVTASGGESCVVKLKNRYGIERMSFYVRAGDTVTVGVPSEYLYVYFASGDTWYGMEHLFGKKTSYSMDDEICDFTEYTWTYTLYPVSNGNFSETPIDAEDF